MTALVPAASRLAVRRAVFNSVWFTARRYHSIVLIRQQFPVLPPYAFDEFRSWVDSSRSMVFAEGVTTWLSSWLTTPATPAPATPAGSGGGRRRVNAKHLLPHEVKRLLDNNSDYVCHRTDNEAAGTCREPVYGVTEQHLKKNPMAPDGVWAVVGVKGFRDYGRYLVIYPRFSGGRTWRRMDPPAVLCEVAQLDPDDAIGWCTQEDLDEALAL